MTKRLDKSRPYGTVYGSSDGSVFYQDGVSFGPDGVPIGEVLKAPEPAAAPVAESTDTTPDPDAREELEAMHPSQIKKLVEAEGLELVKGPGSKSKNIENLLAVG